MAAKWPPPACLHLSGRQKARPITLRDSKGGRATWGGVSARCCVARAAWPPGRRFCACWLSSRRPPAGGAARRGPACGACRLFARVPPAPAAVSHGLERPRGGGRVVLPPCRRANARSCQPARPSLTAQRTHGCAVPVVERPSLVPQLVLTPCRLLPRLCRAGAVLPPDQGQALPQVALLPVRTLAGGRQRRCTVSWARACAFPKD